jgi:CubicO group peptidase (beta-lactamase class C family)
MATLTVQVDPAEVGFDPVRLGNVDRRMARYVDDGLLPGWLTVITRRGRVAHVSGYGHRDVEAGLPVEVDTRWRIYSMTKPITSVAAMILQEEGAFLLTDPIRRWLPEFGDMRVYAGGSALRPATVAATEPIRVWHLLTHTAGLTYGFHHTHPVDLMYRAAGFDDSVPSGVTLAECCSAWAGLPLMFQPGTGWNYSVATDVLGRLIEVWSGMPLDAFLAERVLGPLGMTDTGFHVGDPAGVAALYTPDPETRRAVRDPVIGAPPTRPPRCLSGGGGLLSTAADYHRFTQFLLRGGELDGVRLLGTRTLAQMRRNHLPGGVDLDTFARSASPETAVRGVGFGLGFAVLLDPTAVLTAASAGEFSWGGAASTIFWVDPVEQITVLFFTQLRPSNSYPLRANLRQLVYQALVDDPPHHVV